MQCHCSGLYTSAAANEPRKRKLKKKGSKKIQAICPAEIVIKQSKSDSKFYVTYQSTHVAHDVGDKNQLQHMYLDKSKKFDLGGQLAAGIPHTVVYQNEIESVIGGSRDNRKQNVTKCDICNTKYRYAPEKYQKKDDKQNVAEFLEKNKSSILYFKNKKDDRITSSMKEFQNSNSHPFDKDDFVLVFMNEDQRKAARILAPNRVVCMDGTHGTNPEKYLLHTMMVLTFNQEGLPVAFLLTNRNDELVLTCFLQCVKQAVGELTIKTLITDMQMSYYNAWVNVMPNPQYFLYCTWHVDQAWIRHYSKIDKLKLQHLKTLLYDVQQELDENRFTILLEEFIEQEDPEYCEFLKYFVSNYYGKADRWAYCHRQFAEVNVNTYLESFHKHLKYDGMGFNGLKVKSMGSCVNGLERYVVHLFREEENKRIYGHTPVKLKKLDK
ncbi:uncharacterized protein LOC135836253 [Planococcus citri]|uniref:uncharacterized protein LOC135836253 n=1 Tax=Planococcus citri TaxID=170843 RepID=UPI0031F73341